MISRRVCSFLGMESTTVGGTSKLPPGKHTIRFEFADDGGGLGKGGMGMLFVADEKVGEGRIERTHPMIFSVDETADVGIDLATPAQTGRMRWVPISTWRPQSWRLPACRRTNGGSATRS